MAKARLYNLKDNVDVSKTFPKGLTGQAKIVMDELSRDKTPRLASAINEYTEKCLKTRQNTLRVTLYYIIVFKGKNLIQVTENDTVSEETVLEEVTE